jgi:flagellar biosynthesis protein FlhG
VEPVGFSGDESLDLDLPRQVWAVGGGKGGVGKSLVGVCLAYWLGRLKRRVVLVDADLGGANLHTMLGIRIPTATLEDFLLHKVATLEGALLDTALPNVRLLAGGSEIPSLANPNYGQKTRLLRALDKLPADHILVDLGAGTGLTTLDFFLASPHRLIVLTPQPTSIENAYGFIKAALYRRLAAILKTSELKGLLEGTAERGSRPFPKSTDEILEEISVSAPECLLAAQSAVAGYRVKLIVNMVRHAREDRMGEVLKEVCRRYLGIEVEPLGVVPYDPSFERWAARMDFGAFGRERSEGALGALYQVAYAMVKGPQTRAKAA